MGRVACSVKIASMLSTRLEVEIYGDFCIKLRFNNSEMMGGDSYKIFNYT